ncbi:GNAT family N-acetyltransferase [Tateyamaria omphalii]|uniref:GNAT family N-acetyltransferase n=1 Tax=Tateyamaria omphalii TaxID=299262 RepID=A0A1P8N0E8_9RHOB|nr:GNAT family N-acetyltransferase [Tateyamaria omphalii]APX13810.1 GNAT family N-acetyltransferase [Tateyamaria omphalii]
MKIRATQHSDIAPLQVVLNDTGLFPSEMLPDMVQGFLSHDESVDIWLTCEAAGRPVGFCYAVPEPLADGTWNMLAIAVLPTEQGGGCGAAITKRLEATLRERGQRILIADTSGTDAFAQTRAFHCNNGYTEAARIRDFWAAGDDKIVFWKSLV